MAKDFFGSSRIVCGYNMCCAAVGKGENQSHAVRDNKTTAPKYDGSISLEEALSKRRSVRDFKGMPLTISEVSQLLWAAQGRR